MLVLSRILKETGLQGTCTQSSICGTPFPGKSPSMFPPFFADFSCTKFQSKPRFSMMSQPIRKPGIPHGFDRPDKTMEFGRPTLVGALSPSMAPYILRFKNQASTSYWHFQVPNTTPTKKHTSLSYDQISCANLCGTLAAKVLIWEKDGHLLEFLKPSDDLIQLALAERDSFPCRHVSIFGVSLKHQTNQK